MYIYLNGDFIKKEAAKISPFDHGFLYGAGLFETFRMYDGHPFLLDDHLARLQHGLDDLQIKYQVNRDEVLAILHELLQINNLRDAYIRLNISAGVGELGLPSGMYHKPSVLIFIKEIPNFKTEKEAVILKTMRNSPEGPIRLKSHHFLNNIYGKQEIANKPDVEGIFTTKDGYLAEGITSNLFWVKDQTLYTPAVQTGILNGITREFIISIANHLQLDVKEGFYKAEELFNCKEAFITNSIQEIVSLTRINEVGLAGEHGEITNKLNRVYEQFRMELWSRQELTGRDWSVWQLN